RRRDESAATIPFTRAESSLSESTRPAHESTRSRSRSCMKHRETFVPARGWILKVRRIPEMRKLVVQLSHSGTVVERRRRLADPTYQTGLRSPSIRNLGNAQIGRRMKRAEPVGE